MATSRWLGWHEIQIFLFFCYQTPDSLAYLPVEASKHTQITTLFRFHTQTHGHCMLTAFLKELTALMQGSAK